MVPNQDSSPFLSSPVNASDGNASPRVFWQGREAGTPSRFNAENFFANRDSSPSSPTRRTSIERLQKASRVKNSSMFAREMKQGYDPAHIPVIERPLAKHIQGNAFGGTGLEGLRAEDRARPGHKKSCSTSSVPIYSPTKSVPRTAEPSPAPPSPSRNLGSPYKSSLSSRLNSNASFDPETGAWSGDASSPDDRALPPGRILHRHAKSVTFDAAPPQINEYEMATPDISSVGTGSRENSYDDEEEDEEHEEDEDYYLHDSFEDREDSFDASLEDISKTPVVGPDDWRHSSPASQGASVSGAPFDDPFGGPEGSPMPDAGLSLAVPAQNGSRTGSMNSNGETRPLPPLPGMGSSGRKDSNSPAGLSGSTDKLNAGHRSLPSPPAVGSFTRADIQSMSGSKMTLEERLQLMMIQDQDEEKPKTAAEQQRERRMRRAVNRASHSPEREKNDTSAHEEEDTMGELPGFGDYQLPPRISRESILRKANGIAPYATESEYNLSSPGQERRNSERPALPDPDFPLPSTEDNPNNPFDDIVVKPDPEDEEDDVYAIPEMYQDDAAEESQRHEDAEGEGDSESQYSEQPEILHSPESSPELPPMKDAEEENQPTPRATTPENAPKESIEEQRESLPDFSAFSQQEKFNLGLQSYLSPSPPQEPDTAEESKAADPQEFVQRPMTPEQEQVKPPATPAYDGSGWGPEEDEEMSDSSTPESVIRHPVSPPRMSPVIPEKMATIKSAAGSRLKTRPSATPTDLAAMRETRRQISGEIGSIPPLPERHQARPSLGFDREGNAIRDDEESDSSEDEPRRQFSFHKKSLTLDIGSDLGLSLDKDFDRVIEAQKVAFDPSSHPLYFPTVAEQVCPGQSPTNQYQFEVNANVSPRKQRGYLMRQNTKLVVATSSHDKPGDQRLGTRSAGNSPVKADRPQSWTVEPWNGQRRKSSRNASNPRSKPAAGAVPPLPGQESNAVAGLGSVQEEQVPEPVEGNERGRLFVKVLGVKDLDLPLPKSKSIIFPLGWGIANLDSDERTWFCLTLDNGVHCVTTAWLELGKTAPIGQEFELVVPNELEFQLTLNVKLEKPVPKRIVESPTKAVKPSKGSAFSRVFTSPKKRKEMEARIQEEQRVAEQKLREAQAKKAAVQPTAWDLLSPLAAEDGSFGRAYVCLKDHETRCFGRPYIVDVACFNEWATEEATVSNSMKNSKRGVPTVQRRAPYKVGKLELQLLFVPRPKGASDEAMPKSLNSCIREMKEAEANHALSHEGHLSQQGGDCPVSSTS